MFKLVIIYTLVAVASAAAASSSDLVDGYLIARKYRTTNPMAMNLAVVVAAEETDPTCPVGAKGNICAEDCKTLLACVSGSTTPLFTNLCSQLASNSPYCIPGQTGCSASGDPTYNTCIASSTSFMCTDTGYFPDPSNCTQYHICTENTIDTYQCPPNYVYDAVNYKCKIKHYITDCVTVSCTTATAYKYVVYSANKAYYGYCSVSSGVAKVIMFRCGEPVNYQFNPTTVSCEYVCKGEGWYPDYTNCRNYYECYKSGLKLVSGIQSCPASYVFDATKRLCVKGTCETTTTITTTNTPPTPIQISK